MSDFPMDFIHVAAIILGWETGCWIVSRLRNSRG